MQFIGQISNKANKQECANAKRDPTSITVPLTQNGFINTGNGFGYVHYKDVFLTVIDLDLKDEFKNTPLSINEVKIDISDTYVVSTGSGGIHIYYYTDIEIENEKGLIPNDEYSKLKAIDIRGKGGIIFAEGCKFSEHPYSYRALTNKEPKKITAEKFKQILAHFTKKMVEKPITTSDKKEEIHPKKINIRKGFQLILDGTIDLSKVDVDKEFNVWKLLFRELYWCGQDINKARTQLALTQTEYDSEETDRQLKYHFDDILKYKRPSSNIYKEEIVPLIPQEELVFNSEIIYEIQPEKEFATLEDNGIYYTKITYSDGVQKINRYRVFVFDSFSIDSKYSHAFIEYYNFELNGKKYNAYTYDMLLTAINKTCGIANKKCLSNVLLNEYISKTEIEDISDKISFICGFDGDWKVSPDVVEMPNNGFIKPIRNTIFNMDVKPKSEYKELFKNLYDNTTIKYKDTIIAYGLVSPLLYYLRNQFSIIPHLYLIGERESGKSSMAKLISCKFFGHINRLLSSCEKIERLEAYISASTFPICIDEINSISENIINLMKTISTHSIEYQRMTNTLDLRFAVPYQAPIIGTGNHVPDFLKIDMAYNNRCLILFIPNNNSTYSQSMQEQWDYLYSQIPDGFYLSLLMDYMKDHPIEEIIKNSEYDESNELYGRAFKINKILNIGKYLAKEIFGIDLVLDSFILQNEYKLSEENMEMELFDLIKYQCSKYEPSFDSETLTIDSKDWVKNPVYTNKSEYRYTVNNLAELNSIYKKNLNLKMLYDIIKLVWKDCKYGVQKVNKINMQSISIPIKYINLDTNEIIIENIMDGTTNARI